MMNLSRSFFNSVSKKYCITWACLSTHISRFYSADTGIICDKKEKIEDYFFDEKVQSILKKVTGLDYEKLFAPRKQKISTPKYKFVTDEQLSQLQKEADAKALTKLQMPPVVEIRKPITEILSKDPELQGYLENKIVFTDVSPNISSRDRFITVREPDGTLRKATWEERFRMNQIFFPVEGRNLTMPLYFTSPHLDRLLDEESYLFILDAACAQFDPDDPDYHRVTHATYEHISKHKKFDVLRSTRHFGPMVFCLAHKQNIEPLIIEMLEKELLSDASDTVQLLYILHPDLQVSSQSDITNPREIVQEFVQNNATPQKGSLELALQTYLEVYQHKEKQKASV